MIFKKEMLKKLNDSNFWTHSIFGTTKIIAVKNDTALLIDCKICEDSEMWQGYDMLYDDEDAYKWEDSGNTGQFIALKTPKQVYMIKMPCYKVWVRNHKTRKVPITELKWLSTSDFFSIDWSEDE